MAGIRIIFCVDVLTGMIRSHVRKFINDANKALLTTPKGKKTDKRKEMVVFLESFLKRSNNFKLSVSLIAEHKSVNLGNIGKIEKSGINFHFGDFSILHLTSMEYKISISAYQSDEEFLLESIKLQEFLLYVGLILTNKLKFKYSIKELI